MPRHTGTAARRVFERAWWRADCNLACLVIRRPCNAAKGKLFAERLAFYYALSALPSRLRGMIVPARAWALAGAPSRAGEPVRQGGVRCEYHRLDSHPNTDRSGRGTQHAHRD